MNVSRETWPVSHFISTENVWFSSFLNEVENAWDLLIPKKKEKWIIQNIRPNVENIKRSGSLVSENYEYKVGQGTVKVEAGAYIVGEAIELREGCVIEAGAWVAGPTILGEGTHVRHGAYIRGGVITGQNCVIGHSSEVKSSIFANNAKAAHFAYVGDSILGNNVNLGAGTKISNLKITPGPIALRINGQKVPTELRKFGAILGDACQTGCNSVLNPGVLMLPETLVYPNVSVKNMYYPARSVIKR